jgi:hypothetical protein
MVPISQGVYWVGGYAKDLRPGGEDSPRLPDSEVIYYDANGDRVGDNQAGDPWRHHLFYPLDNPLGSTPPTGNPGSFDFPRDGEYHLFYARTRFPVELPPEVAYLTAGAWSHPDCEYAFDDMVTIDAHIHFVDYLEPADNAHGVSPDTKILTWRKNTYCQRYTKCEVWWGTQDDPNFWTADPVKIMELSDANFVDLSAIPIELGGPISLEPDEEYFWSVKYEDPNGCNWGAGLNYHWDTWSFDTFNDPPQVDAGLHYDRWQDAVASPVTIGLDASYTDDGIPEGGNVTHSWNTVAGVIYIPHQFCQDPNVIILMPGDYELRLTVHDGFGHSQDKTGEDSTLIRIFSNINDRLAAHWKLDEVSGEPQDSESGHHGIKIDNPTQGVVGQVDGAIELDGTDDVGSDGLSDFVEIADTGSDPESQPDTWENSDLIDGMTVSVWIKLDADGWTKNSEAIAGKSNQSWELLRNGGNNGVAFIGQGGVGSATSSGVDVASGWHQVVGVFDRNNVFLYIDGLEEGSGVVSAEQLNKSSGKIRIGNTNAGDIDLAFGGLIDQVRIFDAAVPWWADHDGTPGIVEMYRADGGHVNCGGEYLASDLNTDCFVDLKDFVIILMDWIKCTDISNSVCD